MPQPPLRLLPADPGRNDPCPCGSGRKYKKCHGEAAPESPESLAAAEFHRHSQELIPRLYDYAHRRLGVDLRPDLEPLLDDEAQLPFWTTIQLFHELVEDQPVAAWAQADPSFRLTPVERAVLEAECGAWLSVWEVVAVTPGVRVALRDLLTGEERTVLERAASHSLVPLDGVLTRVVTYRGAHVFAGLYPSGLPPAETALVVDEMRRKLRRKRLVPIERLRPIGITAHLVECWEDEVVLLHDRMQRGPTFSNTDGDPLVLTVDHFAVRPEDRGALQQRLATMPGVAMRPSAGGDEMAVFSASAGGNGPATILGVLRPSAKGVILETNSIERADRLRAALQQHLGSLVWFRIREHPSHQSKGAGARHGSAPLELPDAERNALISEFTARYYRDWLDTPIPMLGNETPRAAAKSRDGRARLEVLLKQLEHRSGMKDALIRPDVAALRRELGM